MNWIEVRCKMELCKGTRSDDVHRIMFVAGSVLHTFDKFKAHVIVSEIHFPSGNDIKTCDFARILLDYTMACHLKQFYV